MDERPTPDPRIYNDCLRLFVEYKGRNIVRLEREMRALGHERFNRRILYTRHEKGLRKPGWIERFGWKIFLSEPLQVCDGPMSEPSQVCDGHRNHPPITIGGSDYPKPLPEDFRKWLEVVSPRMNWNWKHQQVIIDALQRVTDGISDRLMVFTPPRHGKSELLTVRYSAYRMTRNPSLNMILAGHTQQLANRFSRKIKNVIIDAENLRLSEPSQICDGQLPKPAREQGRDLHPPITNGGSGSANPKSEIQNPKSSVSPFPFSRPRQKNAVSEWETAVGGGFCAVGIGGGVTGFGANLIIIDDPIKSRAEAESPKFRERLWKWFNDEIYTRLEPGGVIIIIQTRWHEDDLAGRLLQNMLEGKEKWDVISLPAIAEEVQSSSFSLPNENQRDLPSETHDVTSDPNEVQSSSFSLPNENQQDLPSETHDRPSDPNDKKHAKACTPNYEWRVPGQALCPERFDLAALNERKRQLGTYSFSALYQQQPTPAEGSIFKRKWFSRIIPEMPKGLKLRWARGYDLAVSKKTAASYTASFRCAIDDATGELYITDGFRDRIEYPEQRRFLIERLKAERDTIHGVETALHGSALVQEIRRDAPVRGNLLRGVSVQQDKVTRALAWSPLAEEGKVILVRGGWIGDFLDEVSAFPGSDHDDQIDAVSIAAALLQKPKFKAMGF